MTSARVELPAADVTPVRGGPSGERCDRCYYGKCILLLDENGLWGPHRPVEQRMTLDDYEQTEGSHECYRYPKWRLKYSFEWCGEFRARPPA